MGKLSKSAQKLQADLCSGIGMLSFRALQMDYYNCKIKSITLIEYNDEYLKIAQGLLKGMKNSNGDEYDIKFINCNVFDKELWNSFPDLSATTEYHERPISKFNSIVSKLPYGQLNSNADTSWLNYKERNVNLPY